MEALSWSEFLKWKSNNVNQNDFTVINITITNLCMSLICKPKRDLNCLQTSSSCANHLWLANYKTVTMDAEVEFVDTICPVLIPVDVQIFNYTILVGNRINETWLKRDYFINYYDLISIFLHILFTWNKFVIRICQVRHQQTCSRYSGKSQVNTSEEK